MKILLFTQYFPPETGACANRMHLFAKGLAKRGMEIVVISGLPNYPQGKISTEYRFRLFKKEKIDGVDIMRVWVFPSARRTILGRAINYLSYLISASIGSIFIRNVDLIIATTPPVFVVLVGVLNKFLRRRPLVVDVRDVIEEASKIFPHLGLFSGLMFALERFLFKRADRLITVTEGLQKFLSRLLEERNRVELVENSFDIELLNGITQPVDRDLVGWQGKFVVTYAGNIGYLNGIESLIEVARLAKDEPDLLFVIIGDGVAKPRLVRQTKDLHNVRFLDTLPRKELLRYLMASDICMVTLADAPFMDSAFPTKLLEPLALEKPVVAAFPHSLVTRFGSDPPFELVPIDNPGACLSAILRLKSDPQRMEELVKRGKSLVKERFSSAPRVEKLYSIVSELGRMRKRG